MAVIESLTVALGGALVKTMAKLWLRELPLASEPATAVIDQIVKAIPDWQARRSTDRLFRELPDRIGERLARVVEAEFPHLPEGDREAAAHAVAGVFEELELRPALLGADVDAARLEKVAEPIARRQFLGLGEAGGELAKVLLRESCNYVVSLADKMPSFHAAVTVEILRRERELLETLTSVLDQVVALRTDAAAIGNKASQAFELQYRRAIQRKLDRLELFGVRLVGGGVREYGLSVAYVTLSATSGGVSKPGRVDDVLAGKEYVLIRGEAGSGKTTLLQWLAVRAAKRDFQGALHEWSHRLPVYLRLRDYARDGKLPTPQRYLDGTAKNLVETMPIGWVQASLSQGALLLLDGVDELPAEMRPDLVSWIADIKQDFPTTIIIISSRPAAIDADEGHLQRALTEFAFTGVTLEPMGPRDSDALVAQWHASVARDREADREKLAEHERSLRKAFRDRRAIRNLASNPLLCAMMCALNWDRKQDLPSDRMELYQLALDLLLDRRDAERAITGSRAIHLKKAEKESLLDSIAYWMLRNGEAEIDRGQAVEEIARQLPRLARIQAHSADDILQELLERSGVIREPQCGRVDFVHRTFLEFLGARAALRADDFGLLSTHASQQGWRETIVFAAGHASGIRRDRLLRAVLSRPFFGRRPVDASVTAVCCLETTGSDLDKGLLDEVVALAQGLFPPADLSTASLLAPAAQLSPELLLGHSEAEPVAVAGCIRIASIIGGSQMLDVVAHYANVEGNVIDEEIVRTWDAFDDSEFFERVIRPRGTLFGAAVGDLDGEPLTCMRLLLELQLQTTAPLQHEAAVDWFETENEITLSQSASEFDHVGKTKLKQFANGKDHKDLPYWEVDSTRIQRLTQLRSLKKLTVALTNQAALESLVALTELEELNLFGNGTSRFTLEPLTTCRALTNLTVVGLDTQTTSALMDLANLRHLALGGDKTTIKVAHLTAIPNLESLHLFHLKGPSTWEGRFKNLRYLELRAVSPAPWLRLQDMPVLETLIITRATPTSLSTLKRATSLRELRIEGSKASSEFGQIDFPPTIESLSLSDIGAFDCASLASCSRLNTLEIKARSISNSEYLVYLPALASVTTRGARLPTTVTGPLKHRGVLVRQILLT